MYGCPCGAEGHVHTAKTRNAVRSFPRHAKAESLCLPAAQQRIQVLSWSSGLGPQGWQRTAGWCSFPGSGRRQDPANDTNKICAPFSYYPLCPPLATRSLFWPAWLTSEPWEMFFPGASRLVSSLKPLLLEDLPHCPPPKCPPSNKQLSTTPGAVSQQ